MITRKRNLLTLAFLGPLLFSACTAGQPAPSVPARVNDSPTATSAATDASTGHPTTGSTRETQPVAPDKTIVVKATDPNGYQLQLTMKLAKWVRASDPDAAEAAWRGVGGKGDPPLLSDVDTEGGTYRAGESAAVLYGNASVSNLSSGFDASRFGGGYIYLMLDPFYKKDGDVHNYTYVVGQFGPLASAAEYSSGTKYRAYPPSATSGGVLSPRMTTDHWGPVPFAIGFSKIFTPKSPNGERLSDVRFCAGIGVSCKKGPWAGYTYEGDTDPFTVRRSWK
jgi:hypothetical protein